MARGEIVLDLIWATISGFFCEEPRGRPFQCKDAILQVENSHYKDKSVSWWSYLY